MIQQEQVDPGVAFDGLVPPLLSRPYGFLLESRGPTGPYANWCFAGCDPSLVITGDVDDTKVIDPSDGSVLRDGSGFACLRDLLSLFSGGSSQGPVPFCGGFVGFLGYGAGRRFEDLPDRACRDVRMPHHHWAFYDEVLAYHRTKDSFWRVDVKVPEKFPGRTTSSSALSSLLQEARSGTEEPSPWQPDGEPGLKANADRETYEEMVRSAKSYIRAGEIYQVNLSRRMMIEDEIEEPGSVYRRLREANPAPYGGFIRTPDMAVLSSSPEQFLRVRGDRMQTRPIKGTRARSKDDDRDRRQREELRNSEKDQAELHMIVDLERNDLGRICRYGTVETVDLHSLETFANVHHLVGTVRGALRTDTDLVDIFRATFPGGSVTGAPKIRAMEIIDELEPTRRQVYTGSMGWIGVNGDLELNICIRTMEWNEGRLFFQVGGGIVADSDPAREFQETEDKAQGMLSALGGGYGGR